MKRLLSIILVGTMLLTTATSFAEEQPLTVFMDTPAKLLQYIGVIQGDDSGDLDENGTLTREELVTILIRLKTNKETEFMAPETATFTDMPTTHWAFKDVEHAFSLGITSGIGNNKFGTAQEVTYQQAVAFLLKVLGADFKWEDTLEAARSQIFSIYNEEGEKSDTLLRKHVFELTVDTLLNTTADGVEMIEVSDRYEEHVVNSFKESKDKIYDVFATGDPEAALAEEIEGISNEKTNSAFPDFNTTADSKLIAQYNKYITADYTAVSYKELEAIVLVDKAFNYTFTYYDKSREYPVREYSLTPTLGQDLDRIGVTGETNLYVAFCDLGLTDEGKMMQATEFWSFGDVQYNSEHGYYAAQINLPTPWSSSGGSTPAFGFFTVKDGSVVDTQIFYDLGMGTLTK